MLESHVMYLLTFDVVNNVD